MTDARQQKIDSFLYPEQKIEDYVLGSEQSAPFEVINPSGDWRPYLPIFEIQRNDKGDTNGCTNYGSLNIVEILEKYIYGKETNRSERFQAVMSEQTRNGNDPHKVLESIRHYGVLDDEELPFESGMSFKDYLSPQPMLESLKRKAKRWLIKYTFKHEYIYDIGKLSIEDKKQLLKEALKRSPVGVSVYAWQKRDGLYVKPNGVRDTHWCVLVAIEDDYPIIFDSYEPKLKTLTWDHFDVAKGVYLNYKNKDWFISLIKKIWLILKY